MAAESTRPLAKSAMVSAQMSRMPREATGPEMQLRRGLHSVGMRYTVHDRRLPGTPDVVFARARLAVFVDGCFWHGCPEHGVLPKNNREWWRQKLETNRARDRRKDEELRALGWMPVHLWEHEPVGEMVAIVSALWRDRTGRECDC